MSASERATMSRPCTVGACEQQLQLVRYRTSGLLQLVIVTSAMCPSPRRVCSDHLSKESVSWVSVMEVRRGLLYNLLLCELPRRAGGNWTTASTLPLLYQVHMPSLPKGSRSVLLRA